MIKMLRPQNEKKKKVEQHAEADIGKEMDF